jgi:hypothetical protein
VKGRRVMVMAAMSVLAVPSIGLSQGAKTAATSRVGKCALPDTTKAWAKDQRAWLVEPAKDWTNDSLRTALLHAAGLDAKSALALKPGFTLKDASAVGGTEGDEVRALLKQRLATRGSEWPTRSVVGAAGMHAAWMLVLGDSALEAGATRRFMEAGPAESFATDVAMLEDRIRVRNGRGQLYGTMLVADAQGVYAPTHLEDEPHADLRREGAMLPALKQALCAANKK